MRKLYSSPELRVFGTVDAITGAFGETRQSDTIFNSDGTVLAHTQEGSIDGVVVPCNSVKTTVC